jgi:hypothetical protein
MMCPDSSLDSAILCAADRIAEDNHAAAARRRHAPIARGRERSDGASPGLDVTYQDFDLLIERAGDRYRARVLRSPAGQAVVDFRLPFTDEKIENVLLRLGRTRRAVRRIESSEMQAAKGFGASLFEAVFAGPVAEAFRASVDAARAEGDGLRVRLRLKEPALADLPWEFLYHREFNRFLALSVQTPLVRYMDLPEPIQPIQVTPPIRVLVMIASPADYPPLDVEAEWTRLNTALQQQLASGHIAIDRLDDASLGALQRRLRRAQYHMFHFIGHGEFDQASQEGVLVLEAANHRGHRVSSQYLGMLLHDHDSLRVAILNACEGARTSRVDPFAGTAQTLVLQGIPAVIAMQFEIADEVAATFAHELYGALADGYPIDAALTEARKAIFAAGRDVAWGTPVLYLRAPDGRIFDLKGGSTGLPAGPPALALNPQGQPLDDKQRAARLVRSADVALAQGDYLDALKLLHEAASLDAASPALTDLLDRAEQQRAVAETRTRRRRALDQHLAAAADRLARGDLSAARQRVRDALRLKPQDADALALRAKIRQAADKAAPRKTATPGPRPQPDAMVAGPPPRAKSDPRPSDPPERGREAPAPRRKKTHLEDDLID